MRSDSKTVRPVLLLATFLLSGSLLAQTPMPSLKDHNRALLVFAASATNLHFIRQQQLLENRASELADRDLIVIPVLHRWTPSDANLRQANVPFTQDPEQKRLRSRYNIQPQNFTVILLGKDGGEKLRSHTPVTIEELSSTIDSMPMRQQEIRQRTRSSAQPPRE